MFFSIAQLEPASNPATDPFGQPQPDHPDSVFVKGNTDDYKSFEIERLLNKRITRWGCCEKVQYLVRWKGYGPEFDRWYNKDNLDDAREVVEDYEAKACSLRGPCRHR